MNLLKIMVSKIKDLQYDCNLGIHKFPLDVMESLHINKYQYLGK